MAELPEELQDKGTEFDRLKALSDGVFAIVLTLLVLELHIPEIEGAANGGDLLVKLLALMPKIIAYIISFFIIGVYWVVHNRLFRHIVRYDRKLLWQNLLFLLFVSFLPFTTALSGTYAIGLAWQLYALNVAAAGAVSIALWHRAVQADLVEPDLPALTRKYIAARAYPTPIIFLLSIGVAFWSPMAARFCPMFIPLGILIVNRGFIRQSSSLGPGQDAALPEASAP
jgi:uncharacterized membrane protein